MKVQIRVTSDPVLLNRDLKYLNKITGWCEAMKRGVLASLGDPDFGVWRGFDL